MARMSFLTLIKWVRKFMTLLPLPDWQDAEDLRLWVLETTVVLDEMADHTDTQIDDQAVEALRDLATNQEAWAALHAIVLDLVAMDEDGGNLVGDSRVATLAAEVDMSPTVIILLINAALELISWWRSR